MRLNTQFCASKPATFSNYASGQNTEARSSAKLCFIVVPASQPLVKTHGSSPGTPPVCLEFFGKMLIGPPLSCKLSSYNLSAESNG